MNQQQHAPEEEVAVAIAVALAIHAARMRTTDDSQSRASAWLRNTRVASEWAAGQASGWTSPTVASISRYPE